MTFFGKTAAMLQGSDEKSNLQKLLERIMVILSVLCFACSIAVFVVLLMEGARGRTRPHDVHVLAMRVLTRVRVMSYM